MLVFIVLFIVDFTSADSIADDFLLYFKDFCKDSKNLYPNKQMGGKVFHFGLTICEVTIVSTSSISIRLLFKQLFSLSKRLGNKFLIPQLSFP